jgi:PAS domain S-box-containing protein
MADVLEATRSDVESFRARHQGDATALARQVAFQELVAELATGFIGLPSDEIPGAIEDALARMARFTGAERATLVEMTERDRTWHVAHEWVETGIESVRQAISGLPAAPWSFARLKSGEIVRFDSMDSVPEEAALEAFGWGAAGVRSVLMIPVRDAEEGLLGFASFASITREVAWPDDILPLLVLAAEMLRSALDQRRLRFELERSESRLRHLSEAGVIGIVSADANGRIWDANDIALAVTGYSREDMDQGLLRWDRITPEEYRPLTAAAIEQVSRSGCSDPWEQDIYRRDGSRIPLLVCLARIAERPDSFLVYAVDITANREAERELALRTRLSRLVTLLSTRLISVPASRMDSTIEDALREIGGVIGVDRCTVWKTEGGASFVSHRWQRATDGTQPLGRKLSHEDLLRWGQTLSAGGSLVFTDAGASLPPDSQERRLLEERGIGSGVVVPLIAGREPIGFVAFIARKPRPWPDATVALLTVLGEILAAAISRARDEERRRLMHDELERQVAERTARLEATHREMEAFSHAVSHDLRAPLRSIDGFSRILVEDHAQHLSPEACAVLDRVRVTCRRMEELIDALLSLAHIARSGTQPEPVDLSALATEIATTLQEADPYRRAEFAIEPGVVVEGDRRLLTALLENLFGNAWKFTAPCPATRIRFGTTSQGGRVVHFVADNGVGFEPSQVSRLFIPFQRLHDPRQFEGHGVGLASVKRIVALHGGEVWATGAPGAGATIHFTFARSAGA